MASRYGYDREPPARPVALNSASNGSFESLVAEVKKVYQQKLFADMMGGAEMPSGKNGKDKLKALKMKMPPRPKRDGFSVDTRYKFVADALKEVLAQRDQSEI